MALAQDIIARMDRQLATKGQTVTVKRRVNGSEIEFSTISARVRITGYTGSEVQGAVQVTDSRFVMSPTSFNNSPAWMSPAGGLKYPKIGDIVVDQGRDRRIEQAERVMVGDVVVRIEGRIR